MSASIRRSGQAATASSGASHTSSFAPSDAVVPLAFHQRYQNSCLDVRIRFNPALPVVRLAGELDVSSAHLVQDAVLSLAEVACPDAPVVVDLGRVTFCDVAGLRALEAATAALARQGRELVLYAVPPSVSRLVAVGGAAARLTIRGPTTDD